MSRCEDILGRSQCSRVSFFPLYCFNFFHEFTVLPPFSLLYLMAGLNLLLSGRLTLKLAWAQGSLGNLQAALE